MMSPTIAFLGSASSLWTSQLRGRARVVLPQCPEVITDTTTFQVSVSGQQLDLEENNPALVLIPDQVADRPQQIQPPVCRERQKQENSELAMRKSPHQTPTRKAATRRKHEVQTGTLALGVPGVLPAQVLHGQQTGETSMLDACYAPYAVVKKPPSAENYAKLTCGGGTHLPQPCGARLSSVVCARQFLT